MYIITSKAKQLKIDFDPEIYGTRLDAFGNKKPFKGVRFRNHTYSTEDVQTLDMLKRHRQCVDDRLDANRDNFWIESSRETKEMLSAQGIVQITTEERDVTAEDKQDLKYLQKYSMQLPEDRSKLLNTLENIINRFGISAIRVPHIKSKDTRIILVIQEVLELLEENEIWPEPDYTKAVMAEEPSEEPVVEVKDDRKRANSKGQRRNRGTEL